MLAGLAVLIFYRTALHSEALFLPSPNPPPSSLTETIVDSSVRVGTGGGLAVKIAIFAKKKPRKRLGKLFDMLGSASPWLLNALMNFRPGNWATSLKRDESKYSEWTNKKKKKEKKKTIKEGLAGGWRRTHNHNCAPRKLYPHPHPHPDLRRLYAKVSKDLSLPPVSLLPRPCPCAIDSSSYPFLLSNC